MQCVATWMNLEIILLSKAAFQAPLSSGLSRHAHWSGLPCPPPGDLPKPGTEPRSPALQAFFTDWATREAQEYWGGSLYLLQGSSQPKNQTRVSYIAGGFFTSWATGEAQGNHRQTQITYDITYSYHIFTLNYNGKESEKVYKSWITLLYTWN